MNKGVGSSGDTILNRTIECWRVVVVYSKIHVERDLGHDGSSGDTILNRTIECWRVVVVYGKIHVERDLGHGRMDIRQSIN
jgi:hypothetical protein